MPKPMSAHGARPKNGPTASDCAKYADLHLSNYIIQNMQNLHVLPFIDERTANPCARQHAGNNDA
jgi:hypothetical protein